MQIGIALRSSVYVFVLSFFPMKFGFQNYTTARSRERIIRSMFLLYCSKYRALLYRHRINATGIMLGFLLFAGDIYVDRKSKT